MIPKHMSTTTLRLHAFTLAYIPGRRARRFESIVRSIRLRTSARVLRKAMRSVFP